MAIIGFAASSAATWWGAPVGTAMRGPVLEFLSIRAAGAPITMLLLVLQGVYRGLQDTRTPLAATLGTTALNIVLAPILIFTMGWRVRGAAIATVVAQALPCIALLWDLSRKYPLRFRDSATLRELFKLFGPTGLLVLRTVAITMCYAVATSIVARSGTAAAASHQIMFQLWLASSLLADSLAVASQSLLARSIASGQTEYGTQVVDRTIAMAGGLGVVLMAALALGRDQIPRLFTADTAVLSLIASIMPIVILTQPVNALAFAWDGVLYGSGGFSYASVAMAFCAAPAIAVMVFGSRLGLGGSALTWVWMGLSTVMALRALTIFVPYKLRLYPFQGLFAAGGSSSQPVRLRQPTEVDERSSLLQQEAAAVLHDELSSLQPDQLT